MNQIVLIAKLKLDPKIDIHPIDYFTKKQLVNKLIGLLIAQIVSSKAVLKSKMQSEALNIKSTLRNIHLCHEPKTCMT